MTSKRKNNPMAGIVVSLRSLCPKCSGTKVVRMSLWDRFWDSVNDRPDATVKELQVFMHEHGQPTVPAEAIPCLECSGKGYNEVAILLSEIEKEK